MACFWNIHQLHSIISQHCQHYQENAYSNFMNTRMKPNVTNTELPNHQCAISGNCIIAAMWMRSLPNKKKAILFLGHKDVSFENGKSREKMGWKGSLPISKVIPYVASFLSGFIMSFLIFHLWILVHMSLPVVEVTVLSCWLFSYLFSLFVYLFVHFILFYFILVI